MGRTATVCPRDGLRCLPRCSRRLSRHSGCAQALGGSSSTSSLRQPLPAVRSSIFVCQVGRSQHSNLHAHRLRTLRPTGASPTVGPVTLSAAGERVSVTDGSAGRSRRVAALTVVQGSATAPRGRRAASQRRGGRRRHRGKSPGRSAASAAAASGSELRSPPGARPRGPLGAPPRRCRSGGARPRRCCSAPARPAPVPG